MQPSNRQLNIIQLVATFGYVKSKHIQALLFHNLSSHTPYGRDINELVGGHYIDRVQRRFIGGANAGSGQYVYKLGTEGRRMLPDARKAPYISEVDHALMIADCYVIVRQLEREGKLTILGWLTEPDSALTFGTDTIEPDMQVDMQRPDGTNHIRILFEADRASEGVRQITAKLMRWWNAYQTADDGQWLPSQLVLWVVPDDRRASELKWLIERGTPEQAALFRVQTLDGLSAALGG